MCSSDLYFNPRPPCGGRRDVFVIIVLRTEFQSTSSVWRTTPMNERGKLCTIFQSTSSVWRTTCQAWYYTDEDLFQSTSSVWRTTSGMRLSDFWMHISIHVLRVEDDLAGGFLPKFFTNFNPRPPCGGRRKDRGADIATPLISIHVLRVEDDTFSAFTRAAMHDFNPRPPCGGRPCDAVQALFARCISIHVLRVEDDFWLDD